MRFLTWTIIFLLASCQQHISSNKSVNSRYTLKQTSHMNSQQDSAPPGPPPKFFKAVHPKNEPLSRYGNPDTYNVNGKRYDVMSSSSGYRARGLASWYGTKFHAKRTSSGEHYDMYALTAAHRTLPLPTYIRVKNLGNGKSAIVKVNDRGPFHSDRILDLSYGAAVKLGLFPRGTAMVEIEALNMQPHGQEKHIAQYYLQAGAFTSSAFANDLRNKLTRLTRSKVFVERYQSKYIVKVGPFVNKRTSDQTKQMLYRNGIKGAFSVLQ